MSSFLCFFLGLCLLASSSASEDDTVVVTSSGPIKGKHLPAGSGSVTAYLGIPYAEPPVGKLRFQKPRPHQPWTHVLEATNYGNPCHQRSSFRYAFSNIWVANTSNSEDCLFLNIWAPHPRPSMPVPILVWIHGGGYIAGAGSLDLYNGALLAATENVIVASINYRLGTLGFLFFPPDAPGNMGLWDQHLALKWLNENAAAFGGNSAQLTLLGHSAGAASVGFHLLSPTSQPLFARAVVQSGAPNAPWAWKDPEVVKSLASSLGDLWDCPKKNHSSVVSCLQDTDLQGDSFAYRSPLFLPTSDRDFLPDEPKKLLQTGGMRAKPLLIGVTRDDGSLFLVSGVPSALKNEAVMTWEQLLEGMVYSLRKNVQGNVVTALGLKYIENSHGTDRYRQALSHFCRDYFFLCPLAEVAENMAAAGGPVYVYSFNHHISGSVWPEWMGAAHGAELPYLFGTLSALPGINQTRTEADAALSRRVMRYWAEFARSGNPTGSASDGEQWPLYNVTERNFFHISREAPQIMKISPAQHCSFLGTHLFNTTRTNLSQGYPVSSDQANGTKNGTGY
ncbi:cholinesterase-like [Elgaria multicarinata webbii]|uniref:cholinesterase-like n=1 Tax=Elgaria multicarinata webbii TaxID=159646 RepID=UPI002FCD236C